MPPLLLELAAPAPHANALLMPWPVPLPSLTEASIPPGACPTASLPLQPLQAPVLLVVALASLALGAELRASPLPAASMMTMNSSLPPVRRSLASKCSLQMPLRLQRSSHTPVEASTHPLSYPVFFVLTLTPSVRYPSFYSLHVLLTGSGCQVQQSWCCRRSQTAIYKAWPPPRFKTNRTNVSSHWRSPRCPEQHRAPYDRRCCRLPVYQRTSSKGGYVGTKCPRGGTSQRPEGHCQQEKGGRASQNAKKSSSG